MPLKSGFPLGVLGISLPGASAAEATCAGWDWDSLDVFSAGEQPETNTAIAISSHWIFMFLPFALISITTRYCEINDITINNPVLSRIQAYCTEDWHHPFPTWKRSWISFLTSHILHYSAPFSSGTRKRLSQIWAGFNRGQFVTFRNAEHYCEQLFELLHSFHPNSWAPRHCDSLNNRTIVWRIELSDERWKHY